MNRTRSTRSTLWASCLPAMWGLSISLLLAARPAAAQELTLRDALQAAVASHPTLGAAGARVDGAAAAASAARAQRLPSISTSASLTRFEEPMLLAPLHAFDPTNVPDFEKALIRGELAARYTLFEGGARGARIRGAEAMTGAARWAEEETEAELLERVTAAYLAVLSSRDIQEAARRQVRALEAERQRAGQQLAEGTAPRLQVLRAEAALLDARAQTTTAEARVGLAERTLARLMGLEAAALAGRGLGGVDLGAVGVAASSPHPMVERSRRVVDGVRARVAQERAARLPRVTAMAGILDYGAVGSEHITEWQAGLQLSWPIFTGGARSASIRRAEADLRAAEEDLRTVVLQVQNSEDAAHAAAQEAGARADALASAVAQWEEVARIEDLSLREGAGLQSDLLRAEAGLFQARAGLAKARYDAVLATVRIARARGSLDREWMDMALETAR